MKVRSYLVYPNQIDKSELADLLNSYPCCEAIPSSNENMLILITTTTDEKQENDLQEKFKSMPQLATMALVFAQEE